MRLVTSQDLTLSEVVYKVNILTVSLLPLLVSLSKDAKDLASERFTHDSRIVLVSVSVLHRVEHLLNLVDLFLVGGLAARPLLSGLLLSQILVLRLHRLE